VPTPGSRDTGPRLRGASPGLRSLEPRDHHDAA
jgi:hypothetical protein